MEAYAVERTPDLGMPLPNEVVFHHAARMRAIGVPCHASAA